MAKRRRAFVGIGLATLLLLGYFAAGVIHEWLIRREFRKTLDARSKFVNVQLTENGPSAVSTWVQLPASECRLAAAGCRAFVFRYKGNEPAAWGNLVAVYFPKSLDKKGDFRSGFLWAQGEYERADASTELQLTNDNVWRYLEFEDALHLQ